MADQKISELTALTGANVADDDAIAIVDTSATETKKIVFSELKNALDTATGFVRITGDTMTGDLSMGDNVKAIFGAGSDLQIYHDGANSIIHDNGTGGLGLKTNGPSIYTLGDNGNDFMWIANSNGSVDLYYDGSKKLATTSTGVDITGSAIVLDSSGGNGELYIGGTSGTSRMYLSRSGANSYLVNADNGPVIFGTNNTERMRIDSNGNVGIGTSSPAYKLHQHESSSSENYHLFTNSTTGSTSSDGFRIGIDSNENALIWHRENNSVQFATNNTERMRIDSSGNFLVGAASYNADNVGFGVRGSDGLTYATRSGGASLILNRTTSDGDIALFRKDGTTSGVIGTYGGSLYMGEDDTGLAFYQGVNAVVPFHPTAVAENDNFVDLGRPAGRFKDLYLSGGVYLGGTGSANKLDDYEEGTFTPSGNGITFTTATGRYTKIGNIVRVGMYVEFPSTSDSGDARIVGLPFTCSNLQAVRAGLTVSWHNKSSSNGLAILTTNNNTNALFYLANQHQTNANMSGVAAYVGGTYQTDS